MVVLFWDPGFRLYGGMNGCIEERRCKQRRFFAGMEQVNREVRLDLPAIGGGGIAANTRSKKALT